MAAGGVRSSIFLTWRGWRCRRGAIEALHGRAEIERASRRKAQLSAKSRKAMFSTAVRRATSVRSVATARRHLSTLGTLYTAPGTPNPDTVHLYLHEAGANDLVTIQKVNIGKGANRDEDYLKMNPMGEVPALALADNSMTITESVHVKDEVAERCVVEAWSLSYPDLCIAPFLLG